MRRDFQIAILLALAAIPAGVALMAAPEYIGILKEYPGPFFWGGLIVAAVLIGAAIIIAFRGEASQPRSGHRRRMIALAGMIIFGLGFVGAAAVYFWPTRPPTPRDSAAHAGPTVTPSPSTPEPKILLKQYNAADRVRLDEALYKMFDTITVIEIPLQREAEYNLVHNWESKMISPTRGPAYFITELDRIRKETGAGHQRIHDLIYKEYNYYMEELRDAAIEARTTSFFTTLDEFRKVVIELPPNPTMNQLRVLVADKHKAFAQGVADYGRWIGDARRRIEQKRDYIMTLQGSP